MSDSMLRTARGALPLKVTEVTVNDPSVLLVGENWSMSLLCTWTLRTPSATLSSETASESEVEHGMAELIGHSIIEIGALDEDMTDPVLRFTGEIELDLVADSDWDPWVLLLPQITLVGHMATS